MKPAATLAVLALWATGALAQEANRAGRLYEELAAMDRELFDAAFVECDEVKFRSLFTEDAEFYHDRDGARYGEEVKQLGSCPRDEGVKRALVDGSLEVYPIADFGAVQVGRHVFTKADEEGATLAQFVHLWKRVDGQWRLARVLSYDHHPVRDRD